MHCSDIFEKGTCIFHLSLFLYFIVVHYTSNLPTQETNHGEESNLGPSVLSEEKEIEKRHYCGLPSTNEIELHFDPIAYQNCWLAQQQCQVEAQETCSTSSQRENCSELTRLTVPAKNGNSRKREIQSYGIQQKIQATDCDNRMLNLNEEHLKLFYSQQHTRRNSNNSSNDLPTQETSCDEEQNVGLFLPSNKKEIEKRNYCGLP